MGTGVGLSGLVAKMMLTQSDLDLCGILGHVMSMLLRSSKSVIECGSVVNILCDPRFSKTYFNPLQSMSMNPQLIYNEVGPKYNAPVMAENLPFGGFVFLDVWRRDTVRIPRWWACLHTAQLIAFLDDVFKSVYNVVSSRQPNWACCQKMSGTVEKSGHLMICREWGPPNVSSSGSWYWKMPYVFSEVFLSGGLCCIVGTGHVDYCTDTARCGS